MKVDWVQKNEGSMWRWFVQNKVSDLFYYVIKNWCVESCGWFHQKQRNLTKGNIGWYCMERYNKWSEFKIKLATFSIMYLNFFAC